jgi:hypothetical protein
MVVSRFLTGLSFSALTLLSGAIARFIDRDFLDLLIFRVQWPLQRAEDLIWPNRTTLYTPAGVSTLNGPPAWLETAMFWLWLLLPPFAIGVFICRRWPRKAAPRA